MNLQVGGAAKQHSTEGLELPAQFDPAADASAQRLDALLGGRAPFDGELDAEAESVFSGHYDTLREHVGALIPHEPIWIGWPSSWYIPSGADHKAHWPIEPPADHRYALDWKNLAPNRASRVSGELFAFGQLWPPDRYLSSEAGTGVLYSPPFTYGEITVRPTVSCSSQTRWLQELPQPVAGTTRTTTNVLVAMWHRIPNGWDLIHWRSFLVHDGFEQSGMGQSAVRSSTRQLGEDQLATRFVVQKGRTYLLGVIARVEIHSTLTDSHGGLLPPVPDSTNFRIWGTLLANVSRITVRTGPIWIP